MMTDSETEVPTAVDPEGLKEGAGTDAEAIDVPASKLVVGIIPFGGNTRVRTQLKLNWADVLPSSI